MDGIQTNTSTKAAAESWLGDFAAALASGDAARLAALFARDCHWRGHPRLHLGPAHDLWRFRHRRAHGACRDRPGAARAEAGRGAHAAPAREAGMRCEPRRELGAAYIRRGYLVVASMRAVATI